jgi:hypothetical protein
MKHLLPPVKQYFKAALHVHTTVSDGRMSPEEVKTAYKERGFQIVAYTDHEVCIPHPELADKDFLPLTGYEAAFQNPEDEKFLRKTYHLCFIAKDPDNRWQVFDDTLAVGNSKQYINQVICDGFERRRYSLEQVNDAIARANAHGFLASYNHPTWSLQNYTDYAGLKGLWGTEVYNNHCLRVGFDDNNSRVYQDLLTLGNPICPLATDDFHRLETPDWMGGGWVMIGAEELEYGSVIRAMEAGSVYASTGPTIHSLTLDGTTLKFSCSDAQNVLLFTQSRHAKEFKAAKGTFLQSGEFDLAPWLDYWKEHGQEEKAFIRMVVIGPDGNRAYTRAYWFNELV